MKGIKKKRDSVVSLRDREIPDRSPTYVLALEVGRIQTELEKAMYRIQQTERRQKQLLETNRSLRRELTRLKARLEPSAQRRSPRKAKRPPADGQRFPPPPNSATEDSPLEWDGALKELN